ncbi:hypothetical protein K1719_025639 [Acacia pycnantha]|nr:hypothetical protein K1719_025639 [Acacia pycnantha]
MHKGVHMQVAYRMHMILLRSSFIFFVFFNVLIPLPHSCSQVRIGQSFRQGNATHFNWNLHHIHGSCLVYFDKPYVCSVYAEILNMIQLQTWEIDHHGHA